MWRSDLGDGWATDPVRLCSAAGSGSSARSSTPCAQGSDDEAASALAEAIEQAALLKPASAQEIGQARFDPVRHFQALASRHDD
ncbi:MAG: hypothetical protein ACLP7J_01170 [Streptosporangiaceae bacterium]